MAVFMLNTDSVTSAAETLNTISSNVKETMSNVSNYDTSNEDNFDFDTAKSTIASNIEACSIKVLNTINVLKSVVSSHTNLQNGMKFESAVETSGLPSQESSTSEQSGYYDGSSNNYSGSGGYINPTIPEPEPEEDLLSNTLIKALIAAGFFNIIKENELEEKTKEKTTLVIKASPKDKESITYILMLAKIAVAKKIPITFIETSDKQSTISLVKNGETLKTYTGQQTKEIIEKMFEEYDTEISEIEKSETDSNNTNEQKKFIETYTGSTVASKAKSAYEQATNASTVTTS